MKALEGCHESVTKANCVICIKVPPGDQEPSRGFLSTTCKVFVQVYCSAEHCYRSKSFFLAFPLLTDINEWLSRHEGSNGPPGGSAGEPLQIRSRDREEGKNNQHANNNEKHHRTSILG
jgi:hypothetical protein